jgi:hypothetical protein
VRGMEQGCAEPSHAFPHATERKAGETTDFLQRKQRLSFPTLRGSEAARGLPRLLSVLLQQISGVTMYRSIRVQWTDSTFWCKP